MYDLFIHYIYTFIMYVYYFVYLMSAEAYFTFDNTSDANLKRISGEHV